MHVAGGLASVRYLKESDKERKKHKSIVKYLKQRLNKEGIQVIENSSHIVPVKVGNPMLCKRASDLLLSKYKIYVQPINYPTVPRGTERLRITPTPLHTEEMADKLVESLKKFGKILIWGNSTMIKKTFSLILIFLSIYFQSFFLLVLPLMKV